MHRQQLLALLAQHNPTDASEAQMTRDTATFVAQHPDCFERTLAAGHVTGSAWVVDAARTQTLLMHHRKLDRWFQPGGHADGESDVAKVALKEATEETGLTNVSLVSDSIFDVDIHLIPTNAKDAAHLHYDIRFLVEADANEPLVQNAESKNLAWVPLTDVARYNDSESILRMARKLLQ